MTTTEIVELVRHRLLLAVIGTDVWVDARFAYMQREADANAIREADLSDVIDSVHVAVNLAEPESRG